VALEKKHKTDSDGIGMILFGLAKAEIGGKAEDINKKETKKKKKTQQDKPKVEWIVVSGETAAAANEESMEMGDVLQRIGMPPDVSAKLIDYGVENVSDLGQMGLADYEQAGLTVDQYESITRYMSKNQFEEISPDLTIYTSRVLGAGSTSSLEVLEGRYGRAGEKNRLVAVKKLGAHLKEDVEVALETYRAKRIGEHPNIVTVFDKIDRSFFTYIIVERCLFNIMKLYEEPGSISDEGFHALRKCEGQELRLVRELVQGVTYLHKQLGRCTNELKPRCILIDKTGTLKINDFSIKSTGTQERTLTSFTTLQQGGNMGWRAPEVVNNMPRTAESDVFSVGLLSFFLLSRGHHPFGDGNGKGIDISRDQKIGAGRTQPDLREVSDRLQQGFVAACLARSKRERVRMTDALLQPIFWGTREKHEYIARLYNLYLSHLKTFTLDFTTKCKDLIVAVGDEGKKYVNHVADYIRLYLTAHACAGVPKPTKQSAALRAVMNAAEIKDLPTIPSKDSVTEYFLALDRKFLPLCVERFGLASSEEEIFVKQKMEATRKAEEERRRLEKLRTEEEREARERTQAMKREEEERRAAHEAHKRAELERKQADERARQAHLAREDLQPKKLEEKKKAKEAAKPVCKYFLAGECQNGNKCKFRHELPAAPKAHKPKEKKVSVIPEAVHKPSSRPLNEVLDELGMGDRWDEFIEYGVESCSDVQIMKEDDFDFLDLSKADIARLMEATREQVAPADELAPPDMTLREVLRVLGLGRGLYERLKQYGIDNVTDVQGLSEFDFQSLELTSTERQKLTSGIFSKEGTPVSNDLTVFLHRVLGTGQTSLVYEGLSISFGPVAVKVVPIQYRRQVEQEVRALSRVDAHPNIVSFLGVFSDAKKGNMSIILSLCVMSLWEVYTENRHKLTSEKVEVVQLLKDQELRLCFELATGVSFIHNKKGFNHRDLKPGNILIDRYGTLKITDLGISKERDNEGTQTNTATNTNTNTGTASNTASITAKTATVTLASVGTQAWRAPEVVHTTLSVVRTAKSDCYSMGLIFYYILSHGHHPFQVGPHDSASEIEARITNPKFVPKRLPQNDMAGSRVLGDHLIACLIRHEASERISSSQALMHPIFMTMVDRLALVKHAFEQQADVLRGVPKILNKSWTKSLPARISGASLRSSRLTTAYQETLYDQCRFVRNLHEHGVMEKDELCKEVRDYMHLSSTPTRRDLGKLVDKLFPDLYIRVFEVIGGLLKPSDRGVHDEFLQTLEEEQRRAKEAVDAKDRSAQHAEEDRLVEQVKGWAPLETASMRPAQKESSGLGGGGGHVVPPAPMQAAAAAAPVFQQVLPPPDFAGGFLNAASAGAVGGGYLYDYYPQAAPMMQQPQQQQDYYSQAGMPQWSNPNSAFSGYLPQAGPYFPAAAPMPAAPIPQPGRGGGGGGGRAAVGTPEGEPVRFCTTCGTGIFPGFVYCGGCGQGLTCLKCGGKNPLNSQFCGLCASPLNH
jgi:serine/threonine protein kinase